MANWYDNLFTDKSSNDPFANINFFDSGSGNLPSSNYIPGPGFQTLPNVSPSGSALTSSGINPNWGKALTAGVGLASSLAAGSRPSIAGDVAGIQGTAASQLQEGKRLAASGAADLAPVLDYFKKLVSGDTGQILAATQPERGRVIDQFDSARRAAAQFSPRGGGQASAQQESRAKEAEQLGDITSSARKDAASNLATLALGQQNTGLSMEQQAQQQLASVLGPKLSQDNADTQSTMQTFAGLAALVAAFI